MLGYWLSPIPGIIFLSQIYTERLIETVKNFDIDFYKIFVGT